MKKIVLFVLLLASFATIKAQEDLTESLKIELGLEGIVLNYEQPISTNWLATASVGFGGSNDIGRGDVRYVISENGPNRMAFFGQGQVRYYFNRERRANKGFSTINNSGSFLGFQTKYNPNDPDYGKVWLNNIHIGQQLPISSKFSIRYYLGGGYGYNLDYESGSFYLALGLNFAFAIF